MKYLISIIITTFLLTGCNSGKDYEIIIDSNGVETVKNNSRPKSQKKLKYNFEIISELKNSSEKNYTISFADFKYGRNFDLGVDLDKEGNYYLVDYPHSMVLKISKDGELLHKMGRQGQGPGEFPAPPSTIDYFNGKIYVLDLSRRLTVFDMDGKYLSHKQLLISGVQAFYNYKLVGDKSVILCMRNQGNWGQSDFKNGYSIITRKQSAANPEDYKILFERLMKMDLNSIDSENFIAGMSLFGKNLVIGDFSRTAFGLKVYDVEKGLIRKITKPYAARMRSKEVLKSIGSALAKAEQQAGNSFKFKKVDKYKQSISAIFHDEQGNILVSTDESAFADAGQKFSVFDAKGIYKGDLEIPELIGLQVTNAGDRCLATTSVSANYLEEGKADPVVRVIRMNITY